MVTVAQWGSFVSRAQTCVHISSTGNNPKTWTGRYLFRERGAAPTNHPAPQTISTNPNRSFQKGDHEMMPYLTIAGMMALVLFPVLLPAIITLMHSVTQPGPARTSAHPPLPVTTGREAR
ncbi:hypothetical protein [Mycobacterium basiliense]